MPAPPTAPAGATTRVPLAIEDWLTVIIMALLALITFANVLVRYFTSASFAWTEEVSVFLMIVLAMVASVGRGGAQPAHPHRVLRRRGPREPPARTGRFGAAMVALLFALIAVLSARVLWDDVQYGETSPGIGVPQWWYSDVAADPQPGHHAARRRPVAPWWPGGG
jgi:TRAP-type C4-dicarboxylate transport system permease small subunit